MKHNLGDLVGGFTNTPGMKGFITGIIIELSHGRYLVQWADGSRGWVDGRAITVFKRILKRELSGKTPV